MQLFLTNFLLMRLVHVAKIIIRIVLLSDGNAASDEEMFLFLDFNYKDGPRPARH
jgi:hypothetical protein